MLVFVQYFVGPTSSRIEDYPRTRFIRKSEASAGCSTIPCIGGERHNLFSKRWGSDSSLMLCWTEFG
ncbi:unnamed protein product [Victoria cruziana]